MIFGGGMVATMMGGIAAEATGGDFSEGALTAMVVFLYNDLGDYIARAGRRDGLQQTAQLRAVQRAKSYKEIVQGRKKIDALFTNGANVVMVVNGAGEVYYVVRFGMGRLALMRGGSTSIGNFRIMGANRGGRIFQVMHKNNPIFRIDKHPVVKGSRIDRFHWHRGLSKKTMNLHRPYDTWLRWVKDWKY